MKMYANTRPSWRRSGSPRLRSPVRHQMIARAIRPPSIGKAGSRLKTRTRRLIDASQASSATTPDTPAAVLNSTQAQHVAEFARAGDRDPDQARDDRRSPGSRPGRRPRPRTRSRDYRLSRSIRATPPKIQSWMLVIPIPWRSADEGVPELVQDDRAEEADGAGDREARTARRRCSIHPAGRRSAGTCRRDQEEEDQEPGPVDRDPDPANVEESEGAAAEHLSMVSG